MPRKGHTPEQVLNKLRQVDVGVANGKSVGQAGLPPIAVPLIISETWPVPAWA